MTGSDRLALGIDIGTSGVRIAALNEGGDVVAQAAVATAAPDRDGSDITQDPMVWWRGVETAFAELGQHIKLASVGVVGVDGTSGTVLAIDAGGRPLAPARMYNEPCSWQAVEAIAAHAPVTSAARGNSSALGRALKLQALGTHPILHQADWIAAQLTGRFNVSDENNALKTGYDPVARRWPEWIAATGMAMAMLPDVVPAGTVIGRCGTVLAKQLGLPAPALVIAGTTDGCAAFLATGADQLGDGVTSLGSTLVLKLLSGRPVFAPDYGIYSHRIGDMWLAGGASNTGGAALLQHFTAGQMRLLEPQLDPDRETGLNYYPLPGTGERFPINDGAMTSRVTPRPPGDAQFLQGLLEGIAAAEALGYARLAEAGAPLLSSLRTVGGGAANKAWTEIRQRKLPVPFRPARSEAAAAGVARLALKAMRAGS